MSRRDLTTVVAANTLGITAHTTYMYYLAPIALRQGGILGMDAWIFATVAIAMGAAVVPAGRLADRIPRRYVMRVGLLLLGLAYVALLVPPSFPALLAGTVSTGMGLAFLFVSFQSYVADLLHADERSVAYGRAGALGVLSSALGPAVAALVFRAVADDAAGLVANAALFGVSGLVAIALTMRLPSMRAATHAPEERGRWHGALRAALPIAVVYILMGAGYGMTAPYFTVYFLDHVGLEKSGWGYLLALGTVAAAAGSWIAGQLGRRVGPLSVATVGQIVLVVGSSAFLFPLALPFLAGGFLVRSFSSATTAPGLNAILMRRVAPARRAESAGYSSLAWNVGWAIGAGFGGASLARFEGATFALGGALALGGVLAGAFLLRARA